MPMLMLILILIKLMLSKPRNMLITVILLLLNGADLGNMTSSTIWLILKIYYAYKYVL